MMQFVDIMQILYFYEISWNNSSWLNKCLELKKKQKLRSSAWSNDTRSVSSSTDVSTEKGLHLHATFSCSHFLLKFVNHFILPTFQNISIIQVVFAWLLILCTTYYSFWISLVVFVTSD